MISMRTLTDRVLLLSAEAVVSEVISVLNEPVFSTLFVEDVAAYAS